MEVMIVVVIIGIVAGIVVPRMYNYVSTLSAGGAASELAADIAYTRMTAVREGHTTSLTVTTPSVYTIQVENTDGSLLRSLRTVRFGVMYPGTTVAGEAGNGRVAFDSRGLLKNGSTTALTMTRGSRSQKLTISAIGRIIREAAQ